MVKLLEKNNIVKNIKCLVESNYFYDLYNKVLINDDSAYELKEAASASVFNAILLTCQLVEDIDCAKKIIEEMLKGRFFSEKGTIDHTYFFENIYLNILQKYDSYYLEDGYKKMIERLYHGYAIHFTTNKISQMIHKKGYLLANSSMFSTEIEKKLLEASKYQMLHASKEELDRGYFLSQGFGFSKGISMGAQTPAYWMNHTPESLSFLFGGFVYKRDKDGAMEHIKKSISSLKESKKIEILKIANGIWDNLIGNDMQLGAILIDRDVLEYNSVTYWNEMPPRVEEIRPYYQGTFQSAIVLEESRYYKDIPSSGLSFISVPSIMLLESYRKKNPLSEDEKFKKSSLDIEPLDIEQWLTEREELWNLLDESNDKGKHL